MLFLICFVCVFMLGYVLVRFNSTPLGVVLCNRQVLEGVARQGLCIAFLYRCTPVGRCFLVLFVQPAMRVGVRGSGCRFAQALSLAMLAQHLPTIKCNPLRG